MKVRVFLVLGMILLLSPVLALAGTACTVGATTGPTIVLAHGKVTDFDFIASNNGTNYYQSTLTAGHSYSFMVHMDYDDAATGSPLQVTLYRDACINALVANANGTVANSFRDTTAIEPAAPNNAFRASVIATTTGPYSIKIVNPDLANGKYIAVSVTETTMFTPLWSSNGNSQYGAQYSMYNTTSGTLNGVITFNIFGGGAPVTGTVPMPPGLTFSGTNYVTGIPPNKVGTAMLAYDGPPHSLTVSAAIVNFQVTPAYNQPVPFEAVRQSGN